jgi:hypothetical protein
MSPAAAGFLELAEDRLRELERAAGAAAEDLGEELGRVVGELDDDHERERIGLVGEHLTGYGRTIADGARRLREGLDVSPTETSNSIAAGAAAPSAGVSLLIQQMAVPGVSADQIEAMLAELGVEQPRVVIQQALGGRG